MRVVISEAVNGTSAVVQQLFWDYAEKAILLPQSQANYPDEKYIEWHQKEVFKRA